jgi:RecB family endonuclease NucS
MKNQNNQDAKSTEKVPVNENWKKIKVDIKKSWSNLTEEELDRTDGNIANITTLLNKRYGIGNEEYNTKLGHIFKKFESKQV